MYVYSRFEFPTHQVVKKLELCEGNRYIRFEVGIRVDEAIKIILLGTQGHELEGRGIL